MITPELILRAIIAFFEWALEVSKGIPQTEKEAHWKRTGEVAQWFHELITKHFKKEGDA